MKSPAFQWYPTDYFGSQRVQMMTLEEEGAYLRLLFSCWQHGSIPADPSQAARLIGKGASTTLATTVLTMFQPAPEQGRMIHDRLERERQKQAEWRAKSSAGGKKSAERREMLKGASTTVQPPLQPNDQPNGNTPSSVFCLQSPSPTPSPIPKTKTVGRAAALPDDEWMKSLANDKAFQGIAVEIEIAKCLRWCDTHGKSASRKRIVSWLNRVEQPINGHRSAPIPPGGLAPLFATQR